MPQGGGCPNIRTVRTARIIGVHQEVMVVIYAVVAVFSISTDEISFAR
jgi:hypothetical protein